VSTYDIKGYQSYAVNVALKDKIFVDSKKGIDVLDKKTMKKITTLPHELKHAFAFTIIDNVLFVGGTLNPSSIKHTTENKGSALYKFDITSKDFKLVVKKET
jgi:hypothetical protein